MGSDRGLELGEGRSIGRRLAHIGGREFELGQRDVADIAFGVVHVGLRDCVNAEPGGDTLSPLSGPKGRRAMRRYTVLAAALVLASLGAAGAQESPLSERVRNTLEAGKRTLEERTEHYKKRREKMASPMRKLAESLREADKPKARERPEDEIDRFIAAERRARGAQDAFGRQRTFLLRQDVHHRAD